ncbi:unnamed protein product, partial [Discosporangium mesarthrocarpum]
MGLGVAGTRKGNVGGSGLGVGGGGLFNLRGGNSSAGVRAGAVAEAEAGTPVLVSGGAHVETQCSIAEGQCVFSPDQGGGHPWAERGVDGEHLRHTSPVNRVTGRGTCTAEGKSLARKASVVNLRRGIMSRPDRNSFNVTDNLPLRERKAACGGACQAPESLPILAHPFWCCCTYPDELEEALEVAIGRQPTPVIGPKKISSFSID